ncbi:hypothetical protein EHE21_14950 [Proteus sp. GOKU]|uniref:hypothetical protein n=1 Tax=Proteus TaxID=583 RepID=UPI0018929B73|nr:MULTISPECIES: hypothetical protein [Proteus]QPB80599.1 hypothetical protein EHE21_14950 [Proteus sp. GOKU]QQP26606.1 hypothetical protein D7029_14950 [Proteus vulgaris]
MKNDYKYIFTSFKELEKMSYEVRKIYSKLKIKIRKNKDLYNMLILCDNASNMFENSNVNIKLKIITAKRIFEAILACSNESPKQFTEILHRIATENLELNTTTHSKGKDAVFELEYFLYLKELGLSVSLGEPDIIATLPCGPYYIACKTINKSENFKSQLRSGYRQVRLGGRNKDESKKNDFVPFNGIVAFNIEPHLDYKKRRLSEEIDNKEIVYKELHNFLTKEMEGYKQIFNKIILSGKIDAVVFYTSCNVKIKSSSDKMTTVSCTMIADEYTDRVKLNKQNDSIQRVKFFGDPRSKDSIDRIKPYLIKNHPRFNQVIK